MSTTILDETQAQTWQVDILNATGTGLVNVVPVQTSDVRVDGLIAFNIEASAHWLYLFLVNGGTTTNLAGVSIPASAGLSPNPAVDIVTLLPGFLLQGIVIPQGQALQAAVAVAVGAGQAIYLSAFGGRL